MQPGLVPRLPAGNALAAQEREKRLAAAEAETCAAQGPAGLDVRAAAGFRVPSSLRRGCAQPSTQTGRAGAALPHHALAAQEREKRLAAAEAEAALHKELQGYARELTEAKTALARLTEDSRADAASAASSSQAQLQARSLPWFQQGGPG